MPREIVKNKTTTILKCLKSLLWPCTFDIIEHTCKTRQTLYLPDPNIKFILHSDNSPIIMAVRVIHVTVTLHSAPLPLCGADCTGCTRGCLLWAGREVNKHSSGRETARARFRDYISPDSSHRDCAEIGDLCSVKLYYLQQPSYSEVHTIL